MRAKVFRVTDGKWKLHGEYNARNTHEAIEEYIDDGKGSVNDPLLIVGVSQDFSEEDFAEVVFLKADRKFKRVHPCDLEEK